MYNVPMCLIVCQNVGYYNLIVLMWPVTLFYGENIKKILSVFQLQ